ncbi:dipeptide epimerase [Exilibacterium tricleocarpae]|uniref:Dipeptide epimerase n=1 Tax=Exilibacterium tricleocarpae TaxID=2591008 RepID=A0A545SST0_9GAMM|nr:dipeptide epimerase [Exilibacterium tricleocarpae]TQV68019.1 dipeptide epimerase [Exilibacterium tricleocarpae]
MSKKINLSLHIENWQLKKPFRITGHSYDSWDIVVVELSTDNIQARGEARGVRYLGENKESLIRQIEQAAHLIEGGVSRTQLLDLMPPGGARNAIDCALWDMEAKLAGQTIWELTNIEPTSVDTAFTIGIEETPELMALSATDASAYPILKIKLDGKQPVERLKAIRRARPDARLIIDANQGWTFSQLIEVMPALVELRVEMIEQPLPRNADSELEGYNSPIPIYADESCQHRGEFADAEKRYQGINIKLDKTGGLTEALLLAELAKKRGVEVMVGGMGGTSLTMAPSFVLAQLGDIADLDGPLLLKHDSGIKFDYNAEKMSLPHIFNLWCL